MDMRPGVMGMPGGHYSGPQGSGNAAKSVAPVLAGMEQLQKNLELLRSLMKELYGRLEPVLAPVPPAPATTGKDAAIPGSSLHGMVVGAVGQVEEIGEALRDMIRRLEV